MIALLLACLAGYGVHLAFTSTAFGWTGYRPGTAPDNAAERSNPLRAERISDRFGLGDIAPQAIASAMGVLMLLGFAFGTILFGGIIPGLILGLFAATFPVGVARVRHERTIARAHQAWPAIIEEIRLLTSTLGRSIPQATFETGARAPGPLHDAFEDAHREWLMSTDFARSLGVLKARLGHNTVDVVAETLLTAHELGGGEVGRRLEALAADRLTDQQHRRDAVARQAGVRFARWFVLIVPFGMSFVGLSIGNGRSAYASTSGQLMVGVALLFIIGCWIWGGRIMRLPEEDRVFS